MSKNCISTYSYLACKRRIQRFHENYPNKKIKLNKNKWLKEKHKINKLKKIILIIGIPIIIILNILLINFLIIPIS